MKQKLIKTAIVFFMLMVVFTILSRVIYNQGTPKVMLGDTEAMEMGPDIKGSGVVEARKEIPVMIGTQQLVKSVNVIEGQEIKEGDILFELDEARLKKDTERKEQELSSIEQQIEADAKAREISRQSRELTISQAETDYQRTVEAGNEAVEEAVEDLEAAREEYRSFMNNPESYPGRTKEEFEQKIQEKQSAYDMAVDMREENIYQAQKMLDSLNIPEVEQNPSIQMEMERQTKEEELNLLKALEEKKGKIISPTNGVISQVNVRPGNMTSGIGDVLIASASEGLILKGQFSEEQKEYLVIGKAVSISSEMFTAEELERLGDLKIAAVGQSETGMGLEVSVLLEGSTIPVGTIFNMQIETEKKRYSSCVPLGALHQAEQGKYFVYVLDEKKSILGDEQVARQVDVEVQYKGNRYAALEGFGNGKVIVSSTKELRNGGRVKPQEEQ